MSALPEEIVKAIDEYVDECKAADQGEKRQSWDKWTALEDAIASALDALTRERDAARNRLAIVGSICVVAQDERDYLGFAIRAEHAALEAYFSEYGAEHSDEACPQDDTCECELNVAMREAGKTVRRALDGLSIETAKVVESHDDNDE